MYIYTDSWYSPPISDMPVKLMCSNSIISIKFDKIFMHNIINKLGIITWGATPIHFGVYSDRNFYYWSFKEWSFVHVEDISSSSVFDFRFIPDICKAAQSESLK